jgi:hypothetical protein
VCARKIKTKGLKKALKRHKKGVEDGSGCNGRGSCLIYFSRVLDTLVVNCGRRGRVNVSLVFGRAKWWQMWCKNLLGSSYFIFPLCASVVGC